MHMSRWLGAAVMPLVFGALLTTAQAQGKGKGGGSAAPDGQKEHAAPAAQPRAQQRRPETRGTESRGGEVARTRVPAPSARGKAIERGNPSFDPNRTTGRENARARANSSSEAGGSIIGSEDRGRGRLNRNVTVNDFRKEIRPFATSGRPAERFLGRAVGLAEMRGLSQDDLKIARVGNRVHVINGRGDILMDLDDQRARDIGAWRVATVDDQDKEGSPSFCRSGAGHPVWGRQWCVDKGFGLGMENDIRWGRALNVGDIVMRQPASTSELRRDVLAQVLGDIVFNRLAAHAMTLGLSDPLSGRWIGETTGPRVLLVSSGDRPVAELVDRNRDSRADLLLVALRPW